MKSAWLSFILLFYYSSFGQHQIRLQSNEINFNEPSYKLTFKKNDSVYHTQRIDEALDFISFVQTDFNNDGQMDLRLLMADADANLEFWYSFNNTTRRFEAVTGLDWNVNSSPVDSAGIYYCTQNPLGCSGDTWNSILFYVNKSNIKQIGLIHYDACYDSNIVNQEPSIEVFKNGENNMNKIFVDYSILKTLDFNKRPVQDIWKEYLTFFISK
ncbi:hypothetical protein K6119_00660 [Paracrocinitomix mangrovi]|uniref:hypothetical protein n=1 Tax=Paracrocinitomix mangrovi TaxID=2862509 RepID=UPI001C8EF769|nr:hypothetical protein [Paracrocinitomix mangrovi]UKN02025.1 hypothetical protein K6119_00660 [Paracrocinitomix mangrovi]